jgi:hypothetical protein
MHPDFKMIVLANKAGYPFLGNDLFREMGDVLSAHVVANPDAASELALLRAYAPAVDVALLRRLTGDAPKVLVQDWFKDSQTRLAVRDEVGKVLDLHLPDQGYDKDLFTQKRDRVFELTLDLAINHRKWAA